MKKIPIFFILIYQRFISPLVGPSCRFHPTCSEYSIQAITKYGVVKGTALSVKRILRCNPWGGSGIDPIPGEKENGCN
jgi:putative membrane protein insertion efficiency factor|tara:strand:+ start:969 stop:1202 length:234 start_codon:yes stop_codon:yes gene_type:complete